MRAVALGHDLGAKLPAHSPRRPTHWPQWWHLQRKRWRPRGSRWRRHPRHRPQVGSVERAGQFQLGRHRQCLPRRIHFGGQAPLAHRPGAQHSRRRALHADVGGRLRRRRQGGSGGQDRAGHQGRHRRLSEQGTGGQRRRQRRVPQQRRLHPDRAGVPDRVRGGHGQGAGDRGLPRAPRHGVELGRFVRQPRGPLQRWHGVRERYGQWQDRDWAAEHHPAAWLLHAPHGVGVQLAQWRLDQGLDFRQQRLGQQQGRRSGRPLVHGRRRQQRRRAGDHHRRDHHRQRRNVPVHDGHRPRRRHARGRAGQGQGHLGVLGARERWRARLP